MAERIIIPIEMADHPHVTLELSKRAEDLWVEMQSHRHPVALLARAIAAERQAAVAETTKSSPLDWD